MAVLVRLFSYRFEFRQNILKIYLLLQLYDVFFVKQTHQNWRQFANSSVVQVYFWFKKAGEAE